MEISFLRHGLNSRRWLELMTEMADRGFSLVAVLDAFYAEPKTGGLRLFQFDAVFERHGRSRLHDHPSAT
jgi:hypothetical protein